MITAYFSANCSLTMENKWEEIFNYLLKGSYPAELNKGQKQSLRKYSFEIQDSRSEFTSKYILLTGICTCSYFVLFIIGNVNIP